MLFLILHNDILGSKNLYLVNIFESGHQKTIITNGGHKIINYIAKH